MLAHPSAVIIGKVTIGKGTILSAFTVVREPCFIGEDCYLAPFVEVGGPVVGGTVGLPAVLQDGVTVDSFNKIPGGTEVKAGTHVPSFTYTLARRRKWYRFWKKT